MDNNKYYNLYGKGLFLDRPSLPNKKDIEINYELIGFSEIKKISIKGYCALHVLEMIFRSLFKCNKNLNQNSNQQTLF